MKKILSLAYLLRDGKVCLGMKKRGFGEGNWNGFGGKIEGSETVEGATVREIEEECGVRVKEENLEKVAIIEFFFKDRKHLEVHSFFIHEWEGEPVETEEMKPEWFPFAEIPYEKMWADDPYWLPRALLGEKLIGKVSFKRDEKTIEEMAWTRVSEF
jgi:8-oxo-dGTP pyrophosphatase MutT (NUDIX family)